VTSWSWSWSWSRSWSWVLVLVLVLLGQWQLILLACSPGCMPITPGSILHFPAQVQVPAVLFPGWMHPVRLSICRSSKVFSRRRSQLRALTFLNLNNHSIQITAVVDAASAFVLCCCLALHKSSRQLAVEEPPATSASNQVTVPVSLPAFARLPACPPTCPRHCLRAIALPSPISLDWTGRTSSHHTITARPVLLTLFGPQSCLVQAHLVGSLCEILAA
jgi:hypothetical protein